MFFGYDIVHSVENTIVATRIYFRLKLVQYS